MIVLIAAAAIVVVGLAAALAFGGFARMSVARTDPVTSAAGRGLPEADITSDDVDRVQFDVALRGYRMEQVDEVLDRLRTRLAELEEEVAAARMPFLFGDDASPSSLAAFPAVPPPGSHEGGSAVPPTPLHPQNDDPYRHGS